MQSGLTGLSNFRNYDVVDEKELSLNSGSESLLDGMAEKRVHMAEHKGYGDDMLLPLGSKVLVSKYNLNNPCSERGTEHVSVECVTVGAKEGNKSSSVNVNMLDSGLKEEMKSSKLVSADASQLMESVLMSKEVIECRDYSENIESGSIVDDDNSIKIVDGGENRKSSYVVLDNSLYDKKIVGNLKMDETSSDAGMILFEECREAAHDALNAVVEKRKRGRKRKNVVSSECGGDVKAKKEKAEKIVVEVSGRVLRSKAMTVGGGDKVAESVLGFKKKMEAECLDQTDTKLIGGPKKKQKRRGRPPKKKVEAGFERKTETEGSDQSVKIKEVDESCGPQKQKRRGRPPKAWVKELALQATQKKKKRDTVIKKAKKRNCRVGKNSNNELKGKHVKESPNIDNRQDDVDEQVKTEKNEKKDTVIKNAENPNCMVAKKSNHEFTGKDVNDGQGNADEQVKVEKNEKKDMVIKNAENPNCMVVKKSSNELKGKDVNDGQKDVDEQVKSSIGGAERQKKRNLLREKIVSMVMKAGWTIEYRPRQQRDYLDAVYVDQNGRTHWSITKAYHSLKKRIENGNANVKEVLAFTLIPNEEMGVLCKSMTKVRSDKNKKKNKKHKDFCKAEIIISGEAPPKKKPGKKKKDGTKKKETHKSAVKAGGKSSGAKVKGDIFGPKVSQKGRPSRKPSLVARSERLDKGNDGCGIHSEKRNILSWMIDSGVIMPGGKVQYGEGRRSRLFEGKVTCDGIQCSCCNEIMDISSFVSHGGGKVTEALKNMHFQSGSFLKCLLDSWRKEEESRNIRFNYVDVDGDDPNDDTCNICGDGGDLICCDGCPSTFHQSCLDIPNFPSGEWHCIYCSCKFCGLVVGDASQVDESHDASDSEMLSCCLCEEKFHPLCLCLQEEDVVNVDSSSLYFCGKKCQELYEQLQTYFGVKFELEDGFSWTLLRRFDVSLNSTLLDAPLKIECNSKLALAFSVMDECFEPIMDERSGINRIQDVVYNCGSNFKRLDYSGFFTAILQKGDELISAASIRIRGHRLAEMPFIGTRYIYRRQGMCRRLLDAIEGALGSLGVGELIIPAIPELYETWTKAFGFKPLEPSKRQTMKCACIMTFPGTDMLQKPLPNNQFADRNLNTTADDNAAGFIKQANNNLLPFVTKSSNPSSEESTHLDSDMPTTSFQILEPMVTSSSDPESEIPPQHISPDSNVQFSHDHQPTPLLPSTVSFQAPELQKQQPGIENAGLGGIKPFPLASTIVPKNMFDLNLQPAATEMQIVDDDSLVSGSQVCKSSFGSRDQVDNDATGLCDSKGCGGQPLVLV